MLTPISKEAQPARPPSPSTDSFAMSQCTLTWEVLRDTRSLRKFDYILITEGYDVRHMVVFETRSGGKAIELQKYHVTEVPLAREVRSCRDERTLYRVRLSSSAQHSPGGIHNAEFAVKMPVEAWTGGWMSHSELFALWILTGNLSWRGILDRSVESQILEVVPTPAPCTEPPHREASSAAASESRASKSGETATSASRTSAAITREAAAVLAGAVRGGAARHAGALATFGVEATVFAREFKESAGRRLSGEISEHTHVTNISKAGISASSRALGSLAGCGIGQATIPIPIVGAIAGGLIGGLAGGELASNFTNTALRISEGGIADSEADVVGRTEGVPARQDGVDHHDELL
ncbi:hypothetical protein FOZ61_010188 [Perkinsus olseni]|uniref:Uncharacterized protein n=1 Tax=Perkinsus olseni TaxID=32597 RepID=A0A7J6M3S7_PEROL|nr:hypothetical protein FOZ61_010188 [Perkinsus olseni]KAF4673261.1 hypothetical protein FOL46_007540 [Perkinsus olseni]